MKLFSILTSTTALLAIASARADKVPDELEMTVFADKDVAPCPACLCAAPTGEVFVGVDLNGSLGKGADKGRIMRFVDTDHDGVADKHTVYAKVDNPRGMVSSGDQLYVLHTVIPSDTGVLTGLHLSVFEDKDWDGVADGEPKRLVSDLSTVLHNQKRGADHTTNGIRMGIDGWIYIAIGDFGYVDAIDAEGKKHTMLGGGVVRVRPDGTEFEVYTHGLRNIYDVAIDPFMNLYTRGNTNDGGGWNVRFIHHIQTGQYGYPVLFKNFTPEILPALVDVGGGSGTGAMFWDEPGWPAKYNKVPMMCDWGRSQLVIHRVTQDGPSFTQEAENFINVSQITDIDADASGAMYLGAWAGAGYKGSPDKGYVVRVVPKGWSHKPFTAPAKASPKDVVELLKSPSATARFAASQHLVQTGDQRAWPLIASIAADDANSLESRVAALFTYKQLMGAAANPGLAKFLGDPAMKEFAIRALADRKTELEGLGTSLFEEALKDSNPRVQVAAAVALGRLGDRNAAPALLAVANPPSSGSEEVAGESKGIIAFSSGDVEKASGPVEIDVDITGWKNLYLVITEGGDGDGNDRMGWFEPMLIDGSGEATPLTDRKWKKAKQGWGKTLVGKDTDGRQDLVMHGGAKVSHGIGTHTHSVIHYVLPKGMTRFQAKAGPSGTANLKGKVAYIVADHEIGAPKSKEGPHATPNSAMVLPHVAVAALRAIEADTECVAAVGSKNSAGALWALKGMHTEPAVTGLRAKHAEITDSTVRRGILETLVRLSHREADYDGSWWWGTRPDTRGPYYKLAKWDQSEAIENFVQTEYEASDDAGRAHLANLVAINRADFKGIKQTVAATKAPKETKLDLAKVMSKQGAIATMSIEDVMLALDEVKGDPKRGAALYTQQGCIACHTVNKNDAPKGPFMGHVGGVLTREQIAESILKPNASISQGFATMQITKKDGGVAMGFITSETADEIQIRDIVGQVTKIKTADIKDRHEMENSMMPPGLANALSVEDFASLIAYLSSMKE